MRTPRYKTSFLQFCKNNQVTVETKKWDQPQSNGYNTSTICTPATPSLSGSILFLHGAGTDRFFPSIQIQSHFLSEGWQTICVDMDGHGAESTSTFDLASSHTFLERVFSNLKESGIAMPLNVLAISLGGVLLAEYLARKPENNVRSIATWGSPLEIKPHLGSLFLEGMHGFHADLLREVRQYGIDIFPSMGPLRRKHLPFRTGNEQNFVQNMLGTVRTKWDLLKDSRIETPALHLRGEYDQLCKDESLRRWGTIYTGCERRTYANHSHLSIAFSEKAKLDTLRFFAENSL